jgi:hypothetical protein
MTFPRSHDRRRIEGARLRDVTTPTSDPNTPHLDHKRPFRSSRRKLSQALRARVAAGVGSALARNASPQTGAQVARTAVSLYRAGQAELRTSSPLALSHLLRWAVGTATAQHLALAAVDAGAETTEGRQLLELSMRLEGRAERASVAALTMARALGTHGPGSTTPSPWHAPPDDEEGE